MPSPPSSTQRIDRPNPGLKPPMTERSRSGEEFRRDDRAHAAVVTSEHSMSVDQDWLQLHAGDLISRLKKWSADLDSREAQLNAAMAQQDLRERQFRIRQQESAAKLAAQQEAIDAMRRQLGEQARRLAFQIS